MIPIVELGVLMYTILDQLMCGSPDVQIRSLINLTGQPDVDQLIYGSPPDVQFRTTYKVDSLICRIIRGLASYTDVQIQRATIPRLACHDA